MAAPTMKLFYVLYVQPLQRHENKRRARQYAVLAETPAGAITRAQASRDWSARDGGDWSAKECRAGVFFYNVYLK